jgi:hypothetical protein
VAKHREYYKGEGGGFPQVRIVVNLVSPCLSDSSVHQKCSNYALTNLLFGLCRSMWVIELLVTFPSPHPRVPTRPSTPKVLRAREHTLIPYPFVVFTFRLVVESPKEFGGVSLWFELSIIDSFPHVNYTFYCCPTPNITYICLLLRKNLDYKLFALFHFLFFSEHNKDNFNLMFNI